MSGMKNKAAMAVAAEEADARRGPEKTAAQKHALEQGLPEADDGRVSPGTSVMQRLDSMRAIDARDAFGKDIRDSDRPVCLRCRAADQTVSTRGMIFCHGALPALCDRG